ncbi:hypothetical protein GCM10022267_91540 [Lentzea roselyniae]|uniref:Uncharacterized protein n=1 Tax=Lentzea roselyniae TaxID=531940 RepID=A0ABP7CL48_9PSEU
MPSEDQPFLVETTSLARADVDLAWEEYEHRIWQAVTALELRHNVGSVHSCVIN